MSDMSMDEMIEVLARYRYNAKHEADRIKALEDELSRLRASSFVTAVPGDEYEKMKAENARLKAEVERLTQLNSTLALRYDATNSMLDGCAKTIEEMEAQVERLQSIHSIDSIGIEQLKAQVERLTKAGNALHAFLINYIVESRISSAYLNKLDDEWLAAKEVQS